ncbi:conserved exported protein of unknown function [Tepidanaerobacter acetatoxydans Re1]|uniref:Copper transporter n=1 Tax=Tepidanaerobacter acetatoxydans (strain DSM 21804 / JCM 16047 / Re1) TaxID=1209989 RepID=F4LQQ6_TEPAE|nr:copper transporter [Tepidanaerobacter acetatoxydans]AEE92059.1 hypothetical protein TepRe1_1931 [Tepidanaerobacter acetatoxydans Re1]CCP26903.1 conserved exported protein of unknown function [Tepidanaerobacter acetatoxydans Re1]
MLINIKYLVITVISIFLALGIGILIGIQVDSQKIIFEQQEITVQKMEDKFDELNRINLDLQNEIKQLSTSNELNKTYIENIFPDYIKNKLSDLHVVTIETTDDYTYTDMRQALKMAGADVTSVTIISEKLLYISDEDQKQLMEHFGISENIVPVILKKIAETAAGKDNADDIAFLIEKGIIYVSGDLQNPADYIVMAGGSHTQDNKHEVIDIPLIREMKKLSLPVVGVEITDVENSYIDIYKKEKLSTIDNVDTIIGQTSLVLVMTGKEGHYGVKKSANSLMPFLSKEEKAGEG